MQFKTEVDKEVCNYCEENILECSSNSSVFQCEGCRCDQALEYFNEEYNDQSNLIQEKMNNDLQSTKVESPDKLRLFVLCPGLSKEEVTISFDKKEGVLEIQGIPSKSSLSEAVELNVKGSVIVSPKYRSEKPEATVEDGVLTVVFGLAEDVNLVDIN